MLHCLALCGTAPCSLCIKVLHSVKFVLYSALNYVTDGSSAVPLMETLAFVLPVAAMWFWMDS